MITDWYSLIAHQMIENTWSEYFIYHDIKFHIGPLMIWIRFRGKNPEMCGKLWKFDPVNLLMFCFWKVVFLERQDSDPDRSFFKTWIGPGNVWSSDFWVRNRIYIYIQGVEMNESPLYTPLQPSILFQTQSVSVPNIFWG